MQAMTHIAMGALGARLYQKLLVKERSPWLRYSVLAVLFVLLVFSHVILDDLAMATYHPADALLNNPFWLLFHGFVAIASVYLLFRFRFMWLFIVAALLPDVDWIARFFDLWPEGSAHAGFRSVPGVLHFSEWIRSLLPDWRLVPMAAFLEIILLFVLLFAGSLLKRKRPENSA